MRKTRQAFTLIEILVATTVMVIIIGIVLTLTSNSLGILNRASGALAANSDARLALELLNQDLEAAVIPNNTYQWIRAATDSDALGQIPEEKAFWLRFFSPVADRPTTDEDGNTVYSDICAVSYRLAYKNAFGNTSPSARKVYGLFRTVVDAKTTFEEAFGQDNLSNFWSGSDLLEGRFKEEFLVGNVVEFSLVFQYEDENGNFILSDDLYDFEEDTDATTKAYQYGGSASTSFGPPNYVDVQLTIVSDEGYAIIENEKDLSVEEFDDLVDEHGYHFVRRIHFLNVPF